MSTIVARPCLDVLESARVKREHDVGQWLPELCSDEPGPGAFG